MSSLRIRTKIFFAFLLVSLLSILVVSINGFRTAKEALEEGARGRLTTILEGRRGALAQQFHFLRQQVALLAEDPHIIDGLTDFSHAFAKVEPALAELSAMTTALRTHYEAQVLPPLRPWGTADLDRLWPKTPTAHLLQYRHILGNPQPGAVSSASNDLYAQAHARHHPELSNVRRRWSFANLYLVDEAKGNLLYAANKGIDFATNLRYGPHKDSGLGQLVRAVGDNGEDVSDFTPYIPAQGAPMLFIAAPVKRNGVRIGVLAAAITPDIIAAAMDDGEILATMGEGGEVNLVGPDGTLRNDSRFRATPRGELARILEKQGADAAMIRRMGKTGTAVLTLRVPGQAARLGLNGERGVLSEPDYRGVASLVAYAPLGIPGLDWAVLAKMDLSDAWAPVAGIRHQYLLTALMLAALSGIGGIFFARGITRPLTAIMAGADAWREGRFDVRLAVSGADETCALAKSFNRMAEELEKSTISRSFLDDILGSLSEILVIADAETMADGRYEFIISTINPAARMRLGLAEEALTGEPVDHLFYGRQGFTPAELWELLEIGRLPGREKTLFNRNGAHLPVLLSGSLVRDGENRPRRLILVGLDISPIREAERALRLSRDSLAKAQEIAHLGNWDWNISTDELIWSDEIFRIFGLKPQSFGATYEAFMERVHPEDRDRLMAAIGKTLRERVPFDIEHRVIRSDGEVRIVHEAGEVTRNERGRPIRMVGAVQDVTRMRHTEDRINLFTRVFDFAIEGILITDPRGLIQFINPAFTTITGYSPSEAIGKSPRLLRSDRHDAAFYKAMWDRIEQVGQWSGEIWNRRKSGEAYPERLSITAIKDGRGQVLNYVGIFFDLSEVKRSESELRFRTYHDALTGLPNRHLFQERLQRAIESAKKRELHVALILVDLDGFQRVNDTLGHPGGDQLLRDVAKRLSTVLGDQDTACRLGGDEFAVILEDFEQQEDPVCAAGSLSDFLAKPFTIDGHDVFITASQGIAIYPDDGATVPVLIKNAAMAMKRGKERGRGSIQCYTQAMEERASRRMTLETELRRAIDHQEFILFYQPKLELDSNRVRGMEALVRWPKPEGGMVSPGEFIPLAEETELIVPLGEWVLWSACQQNKAWLAEGFDLRVAVNLSARQFQQEELVRTVRSVLKNTGLDPAHLELEITESMVMGDVERAIAVMKELAEMGIHISVDDFGTGYSSLSYPKRFPIHALKIDQAFVRELEENTEDAAIVSAIISMGRSMGLKVVAEGVETASQLAFLRRRSCDYIQGYHFARPMPVAPFTDFVQQHHSAARPQPMEH